jgi:hypothetical protein
VAVVKRRGAIHCREELKRALFERLSSEQWSLKIWSSVQLRNAGVDVLSWLRSLQGLRAALQRALGTFSNLP